MKSLNSFERRSWCRTLTAGLLPAAVLWASPLVAAPTTATQPAKTNTIRSTFALPANPGEGRDPFFPRSNRPYETAMTTTNVAPAGVTALVVKGVSGAADRRLVIINNVTFAAGDTAMVPTEQGRIRVHCVEIKPHSVVVEIGGHYHELSVSDNL